MTATTDPPEGVSDATLARRTSWLKGDTPHDRAFDLWGRFPQARCPCRGCCVTAEPYRGAYCWLCCNAGVPYPLGRYVPVEEHLILSRPR